MEESTNQVTVEQASPLTLADVLAGLLGWGIEENEEILTISASGKVFELRLSNIPTEEDIKALMACEDFKGYGWIQRMRAELLSRSVSWIRPAGAKEGFDIRKLQGKERLVPDPTDRNVFRDVQEVLRNVMLGWGQELLTVLWKVLMVHCDRIEKRLQNSFPESTISTEIERRYMEAAWREIEESSRAVIHDTMEELFSEDQEKKSESEPNKE